MRITIVVILCMCAIAVHAQDTVRVTLLFPTNSDLLTAAHKQQIYQLFSLREDFSGCTLTIAGHCDVTGSKTYNDTLSKQRAQTVADFVIAEQNLPVQDISIVYYGSAQPVADNNTSSGRALNRRVDIAMVCKPGKSPSASVSDKIKAGWPGQTIIQLPEFSLQNQLQLSDVLDTLSIGSHLILRDINFPLSTDSLTPDVFPILDTLAHILLRNPNMQVRFEGHICCGNAEGRIAGHPDALNLRNYRYSLSTDRAIAVFSYLRLQGVPGVQMSYIGLSGKNKLIYPEITEADQMHNRRVEIVILSK